MNNKKLTTKQLIPLSLYHLMLKKNFEDISIKDICEKAGVSRMSFYRHYSSKEDIFILYCDETFDAFFQEISSLEDIDTKKMINLFFIAIKKNAREIKMLQKANREFLLLSQFEQYFSYLASKMIYFNIISKTDSPFTIPFIAGGVFDVVIRWSNRNFIDSPESVASYIYDLIF